MGADTNQHMLVAAVSAGAVFATAVATNDFVLVAAAFVRGFVATVRNQRVGSVVAGGSIFVRLVGSDRCRGGRHCGDSLLGRLLSVRCDFVGGRRGGDGGVSIDGAVVGDDLMAPAERSPV